MKIKEDIIKNIKAGRPTRYKPEIHLKLLLDIFDGGEGPMAFCAEASIGQTTFHNWLRTHKEFKEAHDIAVNMAGRIWEKYPKDNPDFCYPYWYAVMRNRFGYGKSRVRKAKDNTPLARVEAVWTDLEEGAISGQEGTQFISVVKAQADIMNSSSQEAEEFKLDSREEVMRKIERLEDSIEFQKWKKNVKGKK